MAPDATDLAGTERPRDEYVKDGGKLRVAPTSGVDQFGHVHDVDNLFVCDGSGFPTQASANPGLTIQALAARTADYLIEQGDPIFRRGAPCLDGASRGAHRS